MVQQTTLTKRSEKGLLTPDNAVVAIIDLQPQMLFGVANFDRQSIINNNLVLTKAVFGVPVVLSTVETICGYVEAILPAAGSEFALIPPDNAAGNLTKIVRRFTVRIRFNRRDANAAGSSWHVGGNGRRSFDAGQRVPNGTRQSDRLRVRSIEGHSRAATYETARASWIGRARPQGSAGIETLAPPAR
ncbi:MAG TPA: hypothetical protein VMF12_13255 [Xanthobacteraceae bacterium]|nr:hypothetical protein [Xanthobacteraceae bacterium]